MSIAELRKRIQKLLKGILDSVASAASQGQTSVVASLAPLAAECEEIAEELGRIETAGNQMQPPSNGAPPTNSRPSLRNGESSKARGKRRRKEWRGKIEADGIQLKKVGRETEYQTESGKKVAIAYASEQPHRPDKWFLGLPDNTPDLVVLLCETVSGELLDFVFPEPLVSDVWPYLSRQTHDLHLHGSNVKFNVTRDGADYNLKVPGRSSRSVNSYLGQYQSLLGPSEFEEDREGLVPAIDQGAPLDAAAKPGETHPVRTGNGNGVPTHIEQILRDQGKKLTCRAIAVELEVRGVRMESGDVLSPLEVGKRVWVALRAVHPRFVRTTAVKSGANLTVGLRGRDAGYDRYGNPVPGAD